MKKFILLLCFLILMLFIYSFKPVFADVFKQSDLIFGDMEYTIYCLGVEQNIENAEVTNIGNGFIVRTKVDNVAKTKSKITNILGESIKFNSSFSKIEKIINLYDIKIIKDEKVGEIYSMYGYASSNNFANSVEIDGEKVNIQIAFNNGTVVIGTPIILGDY